MKRVYIHGLGQTSDSWNQVLLKMNATEDNLCPDLAELVRGKETTYQNLYSAFSALCNEIDAPLTLCGLSLGGVLALNYTLDYPEKVESLVLIATQYKMPKRLLKFQNLLFRFMPKSSFEQMGFGKSDFLELCKTMMELDFSQEVQKISCPLLIIYGEKDQANKAASVELRNIMANAELKVLNGVGHEVNIAAPEELAKVLTKFYSKVSG